MKRRTERSARCAHRAFTLIELFVVISIIALLIGILLPALGQSRRTAQTTVCASQLRQFGVSSLSYANDNEDRMCSGPADNRRRRGYGAIDELGWMADFIRGEFLVPGDMLCPTQPAQLTQNIDIIRLNEDPFKPFPTLEDQQRLIAAGYNTNYVQSWYMAYTGMKRYTPGVQGDPKRTSDVVGPLKTTMVGITSLASAVPLFGDARTDPDDVIIFDGAQVRATKTLTDGPYWAGGIHNRQDYDDMGAAHGKGSRVVSEGHDRDIGNIVFADGHVDAFQDRPDSGGERDAVWGVTPEFTAQGLRLQYDELDGRVFGGWINAQNPIVNSND